MNTLNIDNNINISNNMFKSNYNFEKNNRINNNNKSNKIPLDRNSYYTITIYLIIQLVKEILFTNTF